MDLYSCFVLQKPKEVERQHAATKETAEEGQHDKDKKSKEKTAKDTKNGAASGSLEALDWHASVLL